MLRFIFVFGLAVGTALSGYAQERTAGSNLEIQTSWSALKNIVDQANARTQSLETLVNQHTTCGNLGKIYAPSSSAKDSKGCIYASANPSTPTPTTFKPGSYSSSYSNNTTYTASKDMFVTGYVSGNGSRSACHAIGYVNGVAIAVNYPEHYTGGVSFIVPKGAKWKVTLRADSECPSSASSRKIFAMPLN